MRLLNDFPLFSKFQSRIGLLRSILIYHGIPLRKRRMAKFYAQFIRPGDLCFDIGAHVGNRVAAWLRIDAQVVAVEPQPLCAALLQRWYGSRESVTLVDQAIGAKVGRHALYVSRDNPTVTTMSREWIDEVQQVDGFASVRWQDEVVVDVTTLDELIERFGLPAFCKIDVEGFELEVLAGLSQAIAALSFEYVPASQDVCYGCIERLEELGSYEFNWSVGESHRLQSPHWLAPEQMASVLKAMPRGGASGDVYARLI